MSKVTRATKMLEQAGIAFTVHSYNHDSSANLLGLQAAEALGEELGRVLKTLMALVNGKPVCVIIPSDKEVSMKKLAAAFDGKSAEIMKPADAERTSAYKTGGISPFGQTRRIPAVIEEDALENDLVYVTMEAPAGSLPNHQPSLAAVGERPTPIGGLIL
jgi:Cys-tRNA(Pro)/Cys-tRNA(Cys) deacylase